MRMRAFRCFPTTHTHTRTRLHALQHSGPCLPLHLHHGLSLICCPSHFLLSVSLHSNYPSRCLDLVFVLMQICCLTHQSSATLHLSVPNCLLPCVPELQAQLP